MRRDIIQSSHIVGRFVELLPGILRIVINQTQIFAIAQVRHLEESCSAMAEDLMQKSTIIQHYGMDTKLGRYT